VAAGARSVPGRGSARRHGARGAELRDEVTQRVEVHRLHEVIVEARGQCLRTYVGTHSVSQPVYAVLSTGLEHPNLETAVGLSDAALDRGAELYLYLIDDGVRALDDPRIHALPARGAKLFVCAYGCQKRRIPLRDADTITYCGLVVLTDLINGTDRFIALN